MYEKLRKNIVAHNEKYVELNDLVHNAKTEQELQDAMTARWQFIHDYATWLLLLGCLNPCLLQLNLSHLSKVLMFTMKMDS